MWTEKEQKGGWDEMSGIDHIEHVNKNIDHIDHVEKFNPYHDSKGRFASASGYASFTFRTKDPNKQHMADLAVAREKERNAAASAKPEQKGPEGTNMAIQTGHKDWNYQETSSDKTIHAIMQDTGTKSEEATKMFAAISAYSVGANHDSRQVEKFIQKSAKWDGGELMRGIHVDMATAEELIRRTKDGETLDMRGISSWTSSFVVANDFAFYNSTGDEAKIMFHATGRVNGTSISHLSNFRKEAEVLLSEKARFEPSSYEYKEGVFHIFGRETSLD